MKRMYFFASVFLLSVLVTMNIFVSEQQSVLRAGTSAGQRVEAFDNARLNLDSAMIQASSHQTYEQDRGSAAVDHRASSEDAAITNADCGASLPRLSSAVFSDTLSASLTAIILSSPRRVKQKDLPDNGN